MAAYGLPRAALPPTWAWVGRQVVGLVCGYELMALPKKSPLPTITCLIHRRRDEWWVRGVVSMGLGVMAWHWLLEDSEYLAEVLQV